MTTAERQLKDRPILIRFTEDERQELRQAAESAGLTQAGLVRRLVGAHLAEATPSA
ncbi:plasmid mobilization protein [Desertimonas flava]|uniref:plasmid mobilization protein n=1 Tax=Desertimonas flava TaxID=2064846 RepID=UPI003B832A35